MAGTSSRADSSIKLLFLRPWQAVVIASLADRYRQVSLALARVVVVDITVEVSDETNRNFGSLEYMCLD